MKRNLILLIVFNIIASTLDLKSQDYIPFPDSTARWSNTFAHFWEPGIGEPQESHGFYYEIEGDSTINGINYNKLFYHSTWSESVYIDYVNQQVITTASNNDGPGRLIGFLRQDIGEKKVYFRKLNSETFGCLHDYLTSNEDYLLYDFNLAVGDTFSFLAEGQAMVLSIDSVLLLDGSKRRSINFNGSIKIIEGIGSDFGLFGRDYAVEGGCQFNCFRAGNNYLISQGSTYYCDSIDIVLGTENASEEILNFNVFPNPFSDYLTIEGLDKTVRAYNFKLLDIWGREVINESFEYVNAIKWNIPNLANGIFMLIITDTTTKNVFSKRLLRVN